MEIEQLKRSLQCMSKQKQLEFSGFAYFVLVQLQKWQVFSVFYFGSDSSKFSARYWEDVLIYQNNFSDLPWNIRFLLHLVQARQKDLAAVYYKEDLSSVIFLYDPKMCSSNVP